jgi:hypothetical protein
MNDDRTHEGGHMNKIQRPKPGGPPEASVRTFARKSQALRAVQVGPQIRNAAAVLELLGPDQFLLDVHEDGIEILDTIGGGTVVLHEGDWPTRTGDYGWGVVRADWFEALFDPLD